MSSVVVIRSKKNSTLDTSNPLHRIQLSIDWPPGAVSAYRNHPDAPWRFTTKSDILKERRERGEKILRLKRKDGVVERKALYVWVFWCPGVNGFFYRGWWVYLIGKDYESGKYLERDTEIISQLMKLFPLVEPDMFDGTSIEKWKRKFVKQYQRGLHCGKPQGKAPVWAEMRNGTLERILTRAEWPTAAGRI